MVKNLDAESVRIVIGVVHFAHRVFDACFHKALRIANGYVVAILIGFRNSCVLLARIFADRTKSGTVATLNVSLSDANPSEPEECCCIATTRRRLAHHCSAEVIDVQLFGRRLTGSELPVSVK